MRKRFILLQIKFKAQQRFTKEKVNLYRVKDLKAAR